ncbi:Crinkler (CRN) family protein [Phytophthora palmivora]|uniref:Crinkler (CRN) family protein n=1 Tax=Phytophthora palmivora TaxID=4796 RepID=A0A2P4YS62_9STRA|nr:Crinkler (CRN) family protein [Phytophthora palmivora]
MFEEHVHSVLPQGGTFRIRRLVDNGEAHDDDEYLTEGDWDEGEGDDDAMDADDVAMEDSTAATRDLGDGVISIQLSERPTVVFNNDNEVIAADTTIYLRPAAKNYKSVDAIIKPDVLFQVTGAHRHPCKQADLHDVLKLLGNPAAPRLYFVLPPDRFTDFRYQRYLDSNRKRMTMPSYVNVRKIQQFAMEVKLVSE